MRRQAYWLFALVAWPAAAWGVVELGLRAVIGYGGGIGWTLMLTAAAFTMIAISGWRRRSIYPAQPGS